RHISLLVVSGLTQSSMPKLLVSPGRRVLVPKLPVANLSARVLPTALAAAASTLLVYLGPPLGPKARFICPPRELIVLAATPALTAPGSFSPQRYQTRLVKFCGITAMVPLASSWLVHIKPPGRLGRVMELNAPA